VAKNEDRELTLSGTVPPVPACGLWEIFDELQDHPAKAHIGVVLIDAQYVKHETDTGGKMPIVRIRQVEFPTDPEQIKVLERLLDQLQSERTGQMSVLDPDPEP
jgi:hypothetical protein